MRGHSRAVLNLLVTGWMEQVTLIEQSRHRSFSYCTMLYLSPMKQVGEKLEGRVSTKE